MTLTVGSMFTGIGGFDLGAQQAGMKVLWAVEKDEKARELLRARFPETEVLEDVTKIDPGGLRPVDVLTAGWPCQDVSVAGNRAGLAGERSGLWREVVRWLAVLRPAWFVGENVPGLLSSAGGRDMGTVLGQLGELGYGWAYRVLDARYFGVAQRRRRVLIVGCLGDPARAAEVLLEPEGREWHPSSRREAGQDVAGTLGGGSGERGWAPDTDRMTFVPEVAATVGGGNYGAGNLDEGVPMMVSTYAVRLLTPLECERLQGFPDGWTNGFSNSTRYRMLGNAICVNVAEWVLRRVS